MSNSADVLLQAPPAQLFGSSKSSPQEKLQWKSSINPEVFFMSYPGSRITKFDSCSSSPWGLGTTATANKQDPPNNNPERGSEGGSSNSASSLKPNQPTPASTTIMPTQTTSLPVSTRDPANGHSVVNHEQSSIVNGSETQVERNPDPVKPLQQDDEEERVCKRCESKYEKKESTGNVEEWLYSDTCTNRRKVILNYHRSISRLQSPNHHTTTNDHHQEEVNSCCCF